MAAAGAARRFALFWRRSLCTLETNAVTVSDRSGIPDGGIGPAVGPEDPEVQKLLNSLAIPDISKVLKTKVEPLRVPYYKLLTLEELEKVHEEAMEKAKKLLKTPPILPVREQKGHILEVDEGLAGAIPHKMIFTETTHHKDNKLRMVVVREPDGILREATWEERDRMYEVFIPVHGRKMWLPKVLQEDGLTAVLEKLLHVDVLDLVAVQCDPQSHDYHRVHEHVYKDIVSRGCYDILYSTRYFGCLIWHLLTFHHPPCLEPLLRDMIKHKLVTNASEVIKLFMLCYPENKTSQQLSTHAVEGMELVKLYCVAAGMADVLSELEELSSSLQAVVS